MLDHEAEQNTGRERSPAPFRGSIGLACAHMRSHLAPLRWGATSCTASHSSADLTRNDLSHAGAAGMTTAVEAMRTASRERLADATLPTNKTEEWRFTELSSLVQVRTRTFDISLLNFEPGADTRSETHGEN